MEIEFCGFALSIKKVMLLIFKANVKHRQDVLAFNSVPWSAVIFSYWWLKKYIQTAGSLLHRYIPVRCASHTSGSWLNLGRLIGRNQVLSSTECDKVVGSWRKYTACTTHATGYTGIYYTIRIM